MKRKAIPFHVLRETDLRLLALGSRKVELHIWVPSIADYVRLTKVCLEIACDRNKNLALACIEKNGEFRFRGINEDPNT